MTKSRADWPRDNRSWCLLIQGSSTYALLSLFSVSAISCFLVAGATVVENTTDVTSYSYDAAKKELVSYDTPRIVTMKAQYVASKGLAGSMFWEVCCTDSLQVHSSRKIPVQLSTDKVGSTSLVGTSAGVYGSLDTTQVSPDECIPYSVLLTSVLFRTISRSWLTKSHLSQLMFKY